MNKWVWAAAGCLAASCASAQSVGPYSSVQALERAAKTGDPEARWALAVAFEKSGQPEQAWGWVEGLEARGEDRSYLKAWLGWRVGERERALASLAGCEQSRCRKLRANLLIDLGRHDAARDEMAAWFESSKDGDALVWLLSSCLIARDWASFDRWEGASRWRVDEALAPSRPSVAALVKLRTALAQ